MSANIENYRRQALIYNQWIDDLQELVLDVSRSGVSFDNEWIGYVEVQINRSTWNQLQEIRKKLDE